MLRWRAEVTPGSAIFFATFLAGAILATPRPPPRGVLLIVPGAHPASDIFLGVAFFAATFFRFGLAFLAAGLAPRVPAAMMALACLIGMPCFLATLPAAALKPIPFATRP